MKVRRVKTLKNFAVFLFAVAVSIFLFAGNSILPAYAAGGNPGSQYVDADGDGICDNTGEKMPGSGNPQGENKGQGSQKKDGTGEPDGSANRGENKGGNQGGSGEGSGNGQGGGSGSQGGGNGQGGGSGGQGGGGGKGK